MNNFSEESPKGKEAKSMDRRKFCITAGNSAIGIVSAGAIGATYKFLLPNVLKEIPPRFSIGPPEYFQSDTVVFNEDYRLFIVRNKQGDFYALSSVCTHLACLVNWRSESVSGEQEGAISCPCHGSIYDEIGNVISGPAPRPLDRFRMELENGKLIVNTNEIVREENMFLKI